MNTNPEMNGAGRGVSHDLCDTPRWIPDDSQRTVIDARGGHHLVLAPPGCGKTQILTERIRRAHDRGIEYGDMLCLTFTNRAARGMCERIGMYIDDERVSDVYVGNVHRFCSRFLFSNGLVAAESAVIDDDASVSLLAHFLQEDEGYAQSDFRRRREYATIIHLACFMHQIRHGHPKALRIHPECITGDDVAAMRRLCEVQRIPFDAKAMTDIYDHTDYYRDVLSSDAFDYGTKRIAAVLLRKMTLARQYDEYKRKNHLLDFEDLLILTYDALAADADHLYGRFAWVQVDEVQDLNPMQLAIIDLLVADVADTVMYLGDEQQAIFSFMGAKASTLSELKSRCDGHIHHLSVNHRSPKYLLDVFNRYARDVLGIDSALLPVTDYDLRREGGELRILRSEQYETEVKDVADVVASLYRDHQDETVAVVVSSNRDAEDISAELRERRLAHFKVSGTDLFSTFEVKFLIAHLNLLSNEHNFMAWARMLKGMKVFEQNASSRKFVRDLLDRAILPSDFLIYDDGRTYVQDFVHSCDDAEIVVFDTETTGLNVFEDDIVQIAAVKMRGGQIVEGSEFTIFIATDRQIPLMLGDVENPLIAEMRHHRLYNHDEALRMFIDYVGGKVVIGHNADYDYNILKNNLRRYCPDLRAEDCICKYFDTLKLVRLLEPDLKEYKLKYLLTALGLEGCNSHLADDDVFATCGVVNHCLSKGCEVVNDQRDFLADKRVQERIQVLRRNYGEIYRRALSVKYCRDAYGPESALVGELRMFYHAVVDAGLIDTVEGIEYIVNYLSCDVINPKEENVLAVHLANHIMEINTFKEADLCNSRSIKDRIFVTTVHKAKGLEFDNVIVFDAIDGRYPNFFSRNDRARILEDARKFYVAISRARRRLVVSQCMTRVDYQNIPHEQKLTPFMTPLLALFD